MQRHATLPCYVTTLKMAAKETREVVVYEIPTTGALFREQPPTHLLFGREFILCNF